MGRVHRQQSLHTLLDALTRKTFEIMARFNAIFGALLIAAAVCTASGEKACALYGCDVNQDGILTSLSMQATGDYSDVTCNPDACGVNQWDQEIVCFHVPTLPSDFGDFAEWRSTSGYYADCDEALEAVRSINEFFDDVANAAGTILGIGVGVTIAIIVIPIIIVIVVISLIVWCCCCRNKNNVVVVQQQPGLASQGACKPAV